MQRLLLNGDDWRCAHFCGPRDQQMQDQLVHANVTLSEVFPSATPKLFAASVPGSPYLDMVRAEEIDNPYVGRNARACEWIAQRHWLYLKSFDTPKDWRERRIRLVLQGLDYQAAVYLNGQLLGEHVGQFVPARFDITDHVRHGEPNLLAVALHRAPDEEPQVGHTRAVRTLKTRVNYDWDFCAKVVGIGIWDDVYLEATGPLWLEDPFVYTHLEHDEDRGDVWLDTGFGRAWQSNAGPSRPARIPYAYEVIVRDGETELARATGEGLAEEAGHLRRRFEVRSPKRWWPNGLGEQPLYQVEVALRVEGRVSDRRVLTTAFRTLELAPTPGAPPAARPYSLRVNRRDVPIRGWNWVPPDVQYGLPMAERYHRLIALARQAGVNMLRVWGGGLVEKEIFYELCDQAGILVWQEFPLSSSGICNEPSTDGAYLAELGRQIPAIIRTRRNHPSLALWCGGNELQYAGYKPLDEQHPTLALLKQLVERHHPGCLYLPTSPTGPLFGLAESVLDRPDDHHDIHGPWKYHGGCGDHYAVYNGNACRLHSEFGAPGGAHPDTFDLFMTGKTTWPPRGAEADWDWHGPGWTMIGEVEALFGPLGGRAKRDRYLLASQWAQFEGLRYAIESNRRRGARCAGTLPWQYNEPWPNAHCTTAVDWFTQPKAGYEAVRLAYRPFHASLRYDALTVEPGGVWRADAWLHADHPGDVTVQLEGRDLHGAPLPWLCASTYRCLLERAEDKQLAALEIPVPTDWTGPFFVALQLTVADKTTRNLYAFGTSNPPLAAWWNLEQTTLKVEEARVDGGHLLRLENTGPAPAWWVRLWQPRLDAAMPPHPNQGLPAALFDEDYLVLWPGEKREVTVRSCEAALDGLPWRVQAWNSDAIKGEWATR